MIRLDKQKALLLHQLVVDASGGSSGVRDFGLLDSAIESAYQTFGGEELYKTLEEKGARLGFNLVSNHAFIDGNKRIGLLIMLTFLAVNGINLKFSDSELVDIGLSLADGKTDYEGLLSWINAHKFNLDFD